MTEGDDYSHRLEVYPVELEYAITPSPGGAAVRARLPTRSERDRGRRRAHPAGTGTTIDVDAIHRAFAVTREAYRCPIRILVIAEIPRQPDRQDF